MPNDIRQRATREMLVHSFFDWKSAVLLALVIILTFFTFLIFGASGWLAFWPIFGVVGELALAWSNLNDPEFGRRVVAEMLEDEFSPQRLNSRDLRQWVDRALDYRSRIEANIRETQDGLLKDHLLDVANEIEHWIKNVYEIATRLDKYRTNPVIRQDLQSVPARIDNLEKELAQARDPAVRAQIEATLQNKRTQLDHLKHLESAMQRAELQLESTLSALGTVYSQTLLVDAKDMDSGRAKRLRQDIADQVDELKDLLTTMDEVHLSSAAGP
jgi:hypothetical protein